MATETAAYSILQVELFADGSSEGPLRSLHFDASELSEFKEAALAEMTKAAQAAVPSKVVKRLVYKDDEDDWCTLDAESIADALAFAKPGEWGSGMHLLHVHVIVGEPTQPPVEEAPSPAPREPQPEPSTPQQTEAPAAGSSSSSSSSSSGAAAGSPFGAMQASIMHGFAMVMLQRWSQGADLEQLLPRLATAALGIVEEAQNPELYALIEILLAFQEGQRGPRHLPHVLPEFIAVAQRLPQETAAGLFKRFKEEAARVASEMATERAAPPAEPEAAAPRAEVHRDVACDCCSARPIIGRRFKSLELEDYDLCEKCFALCEREPHAWVQVKGGSVDCFFPPVRAAAAASPASSNEQEGQQQQQQQQHEHLQQQLRQQAPLSFQEQQKGQEEHPEEEEEEEAEPNAAKEGGEKETEEQPKLEKEGEKPQEIEEAAKDEEEEEPAAAARAALDALDGAALRAAFEALAAHPDEVVRRAVATALRGAALQAAAQDASEDKHDEKEEQANKEVDEEAEDKVKRSG